MEEQTHQVVLDTSLPLSSIDLAVVPGQVYVVVKRTSWRATIINKQVLQLEPYPYFPLLLVLRLCRETLRTSGASILGNILSWCPLYFFARRLLWHWDHLRLYDCPEETCHVREPVSSILNSRQFRRRQDHTVFCFLHKLFSSQILPRNSGLYNRLRPISSLENLLNSCETMAPATPGPSQPRQLLSGISTSRTSTPSSQYFDHHPSTSAATASINSQARMQNAFQTPASHSAHARAATPAYSIASTPSGRRSRAASSIGGGESNQIICAVSEARGIAPSVGIAFINVSTGEAVLSQICDNQSYVKTTHKLTVFEPSRILIVSTSCPPNHKSSLFSTIEEELPGTPIIPLNRKYWSETAGLEFIQTLAFREDVEAVQVAIEGNFYATCSLSAVCSQHGSRALCC